MMSEFPEAFGTEMPTLSDILHQRESGSYFTKFGIEKVEWLESPGSAVLEELTLRFNSQYFSRKIASETLEQWQLRLQVTTDRICRRYCRALRLMARYEEKLDDDVIDKTVQTSALTSSSTSRSRASELPDTPVELPDIGQVGYAGSVADSIGSSSDGGTVTTERSGDIISQLSRSIDGWRDIISEMVDEYDRCFLKIEWY